MKYYRLIAIFVVLLNLFLQSSILIYANNIEVETAFSDDIYIENTFGTKYENAVELLLALKLLDGFQTNFKYDAPLKRGEFANVIVKLCGLSSNESKKSNDDFELIDNFDKIEQIPTQINSTLYLDVPMTHQYYKEIEIITNLGLMKGYTNGNFGADENIEIAQVVKVLVSVLGFEYLAINSGGYPTGYMMLGSQKGIFKGVDISKIKDINWGDFCILLYNTLFVDIIKQNAWGKNNDFDIVKGRNLLSENFSIYKSKGIVTANSVTSLSGAVDGNQDEIEIDGQIYRIREFLTKEDYLGQSVEFFYYDNDKTATDKTIILIRLADINNKPLVIKDLDIESIETNKITYTKDKSLYSVNVFENAPVIYNGVYFTSFKALPEQYKEINNGEIKLIATTNNEYNLVFIWNYDSYIVEKVVLNPLMLITDSENSYNKTTKLNLDDKEIINGENGISIPTGKVQNVLYYKDGNRVTIRDIKSGDSVLVARSINVSGEKTVTVIASNKTVTGSITEIAENTLFIDGVEYFKAKNFNKNISVAQGAKFYLDFMNKIIGLDNKLAKSSQYGYLMDIKTTQDLNKLTSAKVLLASGAQTVFQVKEKLNLNNNTISASELINSPQILNAGYQARNEHNIKRQIIIYDTDDKGVIIKIITASATDKTAPLSLFEYENVGGKLVTLPGAKKNRIMERAAFFDFVPNPTSLIFDVRASSSDKWTAISGSISTVAVSGNWTMIRAYNVNEDMTSSLLVVYDKSLEKDNSGGVLKDDVRNTSQATDKSILEKARRSTSIAIIKQISLSLDNDGEQIYSILCATNGTTTKYTLQKSIAEYVDTKNPISVFSKLQIGDVWRFEANSFNEIQKGVELVNTGGMSFEQIKDKGNFVDNKGLDESGPSRDYYMVMGEVVGSSSKSLVIGAIGAVEGTNNFYTNDSVEGTAEFLIGVPQALYLNAWGANSTRIYLYEKSKNSVSVSSEAEVRKGDIVATFNGYLAIFTMCIIRE